jgi:hypothetical protein
MYAIIAPAYAYWLFPLFHLETSVHKNNNKYFCDLISCTADVLTQSFVLELSFKSVPRKRNERIRISAVQEIRLQNYLL